MASHNLAPHPSNRVDETSCTNEIPSYEVKEMEEKLNNKDTLESFS